MSKKASGRETEKPEKVKRPESLKDEEMDQVQGAIATPPNGPGKKPKSTEGAGRQGLYEGLDWLSNT